MKSGKTKILKLLNDNVFGLQKRVTSKSREISGKAEAAFIWRVWPKPHVHAQLDDQTMRDTAYALMDLCSSA